VKRGPALVVAACVRMDGGALLEYFAPLQAWLDRRNAAARPSR